ncbi:MAG: DNA internalization-related competence protein ComEC/Rec2 [Nitrospirae bacterium]|nr:MAG: DNA internalization-related competence protein ComEC/Rec2 [Nitrospirota bacterium]
MSFFISFLSGVIFFYSIQYFPYISGILFVLSAAILILKKRYLLIPVIALGILYAFLKYLPEHDYPAVKGREMIVSGVFDSKPVETSYGKFIQEFHVDSAVDSETEEPLEELDDDEVRVISDAEFEVGDRYELLLKPGKDRTRFNPGGMHNHNSNAYYAQLLEVNKAKGNKKSIFAIFPLMRVELNSYITDNFTSDSAALITAITTGQRSEMSRELRAAFNSTGLAHILSISGTHFGLFSVFLFGLFGFAIKYLPYRILQRLTLYITPSQGAAVLCLPFMVAYLGLSGWSIPAIRSFIMISLFLIGLLIGRKGFWLNSLLFAAFVIVLWSPDAIFSLSFQLSFIAVLCIGFAVGYKKEDAEDSGEQKSKNAEAGTVLNRFFSSGLQVLRSSLLISLAASLGTAPLVAYHFHYFSVISPLSNLIVTPLIGFILLPLSLLSSFVFMVTDYYPFISLIKIVADLSVYLVKFMSDVPFSDIKIPAFPAYAVILFYAGFMPYFLLKRKKYALIIPLIPVIICFSVAAFQGKHALSVTYLDVGQGDAAIVELPDKRTLVIDTGRTGKEAEAFLRYCGKESIDAVVLSHSHPDHTGGAEYLLRNFKVKELWDNGRLIYADEFPKATDHRILERGDVMEGRGYRVYALHPYKGFYTMEGNDYNEENNSSLVLKIEGKNASLLFTGDIEEEAEENIAYLGKWLKSDAIKVPHHGGKTSGFKPFLDLVSPQVAVISAGRENSFGHPHRETLDMLGEVMSNPPIPPLAKGGEGGFVAAVKIFRTDIDGAIKISEKDGRLEIKTFKDFQFSKAKNFKDEAKNFRRLFEVW